MSYKSNKDDFKYSKFSFTPEKTGFLHWIQYVFCQRKTISCETIPCGQLVKKGSRGKSVKNWTDYVRPNFELEGKYTGVWSDFQNKFGEFYIYSVLVE